MLRILVGVLLGSAPAWADTHSVTLINGAAEAITRVEITPSGGAGDNRLRSQLPPGAQAKIAYSTGCKATLRIGYAGGRAEDHAGLDVCSDPRVTAGQNGTPGTPMAATPAAGAKPGTAKPVIAIGPVKAPPPVVPPWTGKSITKRFGGME